MVYAAYNLSGIANSSGIVELFQTVNSELMFDKLGFLILLSIFLITLLAFYLSSKGNLSKSVAASSFISFIIALLLSILGMVSDLVIYISLIILALAIVFIKSD